MIDLIKNKQASLSDIAILLANGNPGAIRVLSEILNANKDNLPKVLRYYLMMDSLAIRNADIWMLYKDVCGEDISKMCLVLTNTYEYRITVYTLKEHITEGKPFDKLYTEDELHEDKDFKLEELK